MRKLIRSLVFGALILIVICALMSISLAAYIQRYYAIKLPQETTILVLGNSHPECAIMDDKIFGLKNFARSAEPLFYTKEKLKWLLKWNPQIKLVCVELSENQLESRMSDWIWSAESVQRHVASLFPYLDFDYHLEAFKVHQLRYAESLFIGMKRSFKGIFLEDNKRFFSFLEWGGFKSQSGSHIMELGDSLNAISGNQENLIPNQDNLDALYGIQDICTKEQRDLVFIRCPYHPKKSKKFEEAYFHFFEKNPDLVLLDFSGFEMQDDCYFDEQHLNVKGAQIFTAHFKQVISKKVTDN
jgi:hypothetical protein